MCKKCRFGAESAQFGDSFTCFVTGYRRGSRQRRHGRHGAFPTAEGGRRGGRQGCAFLVGSGRARSDVRWGQGSDVQFRAGRHGGRPMKGIQAVVRMQRVRIQPGLGSGSTLQYSTFRSLLQGTSGADCGTAGAGGRWSVARNGRDRCAQTAASIPRRDGDGLEPRRHGGITSRSLTHSLESRTHAGIHKGGVAGGVPPHKGGPERPDRPATVASCQWPVVSGRWPETAGGGNDLVVTRGMGNCTPVLDCTRVVPICRPSTVLVYNRKWRATAMFQRLKTERKGRV